MKHEGSLEIWNHGPGVTPEELARVGVDPVLACPQESTKTLGVLGCSHCRGMVILNPDRTRERAYCFKCGQYICDGCAAILHATLVCEPMEKKIEQTLEAAIKGSVIIG